MNLYFIVIIILLLSSYAVWYFVFNIYEVKYKINLISEVENGGKIFELESIALNLTGSKVPFRNVDFDFEITSGDSLIELIPRKSSFELSFKSIQKNGQVTFKVKNRLSLFPQILKLDLSVHK